MSHKCGSVVVLLGLIINVALYGQKKADFSRFVVTGDSLGSGYQMNKEVIVGRGPNSGR